MPHRKIDDGVLKRAKEAIAYYDTLIRNARAIKSASLTDEVKAALENVRELEFDAGAKKEAHLARHKDNDSVLAHGYQQAQKAYQSVITLFEKPDDMITVYLAEKAKEEAFIANAERGTQTRE